VIHVRHQIAACVLLIGSVAVAEAQQHETQLFELNAYEPVPSPGGKVIAYVLTGRRVEMFAGLGRSHLQSDVRFCDPNGHTLQGSNMEGFLGEWLSDSSAVVGYRDWRFDLLSPSGSRESDSMLQGRDTKALLRKEQPERVAYLSKLGKFIWIEPIDTGTLLHTKAGPIAEFKGQFIRTPAVVVPPRTNDISQWEKWTPVTRCGSARRRCARLSCCWPQPCLTPNACEHSVPKMHYSGKKLYEEDSDAGMDILSIYSRADRRFLLLIATTLIAAIISRREARIGDRITNRKMIYNLSLFGSQVEMTVHLIIIESTDARRTQSKRFGGEVQAVANSACF